LTATAGIAAFGASCANFFGKYANTVWAAARAAGNASRVTLVVAAFGLGYTIGSYINCINGWEMLEAPEQFSPEIPWNEPAFSFSP
jgi:hypothetical protein